MGWPRCATTKMNYLTNHTWSCLWCSFEIVSNKHGHEASHSKHLVMVGCLRNGFDSMACIGYWSRALFLDQQSAAPGLLQGLSCNSPSPRLQTQLHFCFPLLTPAHALRRRIPNKITTLSMNLIFGKHFSFSSNLKSERATLEGIYQSTTLTLFSLPQLPRARNKSRFL